MANVENVKVARALRPSYYSICNIFPTVKTGEESRMVTVWMSMIRSLLQHLIPNEIKWWSEKQRIDL